MWVGEGGHVYNLIFHVIYNNLFNEWNSFNSARILVASLLFH